MPPLLDTLTSYVPAFVTRLLAVGGDPWTQPLAARFPAVVLFADISGFTTLADRLAAHGPAGAEELTGALNAYFGQLIDLIAAHGGEVIKFAGDALLALWPATSEDLATTTGRVAQCGLAAQERLHAYGAAAGVTMSMRIGIGAGEVLALVVGGVGGRWELLVAGDPLTEMSVAEHLARPGEVVLPPTTWTLIQARGTGDPRGEGYMCLEAMHAAPPPPALARRAVPALAESALRPYIPDVVLARLDAGHTAWLAELRRVTVVFLNLIGLDYLTPDARDTVQAVLCSVQEALAYYEGTARQFMVDDKGTVLVAAFGLPPYTHEDDAARAVQAAQLIQANLRQLGLRSAIGITTGQAFCGPIGNNRRREYTLIGAVINLAARLMQAAPDSILCDAATAQAAQPRLTFAALPPITVKGKGAPVAVYRPQGQARLVLRTQVLVGRMAERALLTSRLQALTQGAGGAIVIEGEAGIGKSRLAGETQAAAEALNVTVLAGTGDAIEQTAAYHAWRSIFSQLLHLDALTDPEARRTQALAQLAADPKLLELAPLLNDVLPLDLPNNALTTGMRGDLRAGNIRDLLLRLVQGAARQGPVLVILEDAHWLDSASWGLIQALVRRPPDDAYPVLLLLVARPLPDPVPPVYADLLQMPATEWLRLGPLTQEDILALVCRRLDVETVPEPVAALILERAEGNPFFSEELAYTLRDTGLIQIVNGACRIAPEVDDLRAVRLPDTLQGIITSRIDRLPPALQLTLKVASVIGRSFAFSTLRDVHPVAADRTRLAAALATLDRLDLTPLQTPEPELTYIFKHAITQEVAYNLMLFAQRRELHRAVAEWYERTYQQDLVPFYPLLAHHWGKAEMQEQTLDYLEKAAEQALRSYANQEAVDFLNEALRLAAPPATAAALIRQARWERRLAEAHYCLGQIAVSRFHFERTLALLGWPVPGRHRAGPVLPDPGFHDDTPLLLAMAAREDPAARSEAARAYERLAQIHYAEHERLPCLYAAMRARRLAPGPDSPGLARGLANSALAAAIIGRPGRASVFGRQARAAAERTGNLSTLAYVMEITGIAAAGRGRWGEARAALNRAAELADHLGDRHRWEESVAHLAHVDYYQGNFALSAKLRAEIYTSALRRGVREGQVWGLLGRIPILLILDYLDKKSVERVAALLDEPLSRTDRLSACECLARAWLRQGEITRARNAANTAMRLLAHAPPLSHYSVHAYAGVAEVYLALLEGDYYPAPLERQALLRSAAQACQALRQFAQVFPIARPQAWLRQGLFDWLDGHPARARRAWRQALTAAERLHMPYEQGLTYFELGRHAPHPAPDLEQASAIFTRLGAAYDLMRIETVLRQG